MTAQWLPWFTLPLITPTWPLCFSSGQSSKISPLCCSTASCNLLISFHNNNFFSPQYLINLVQYMVKHELLFCYCFKLLIKILQCNLPFWFLHDIRYKGLMPRALMWYDMCLADFIDSDNKLNWQGRARCWMQPHFVHYARVNGFACRRARNMLCCAVAKVTGWHNQLAEQRLCDWRRVHKRRDNFPTDICPLWSSLCVCVCVWEKNTEKERERDSNRDRNSLFRIPRAMIQLIYLHCDWQPVSPSPLQRHDDLKGAGPSGEKTPGRVTVASKWDDH